MTIKPFKEIESIRDFDRFIEIYTSSIEQREQKSRADIIDLLQRPDYSLLFAKEDGIVVGFSLWYLSRENNIALLEYLATDNSKRNSGIGASLVRAGIAAATGRHVLIEVDSEREETEDQALRLRRKQFYARLGARQLGGLDYQLPLASETPLPVMDLMIQSKKENLIINRPQLQLWLEDIYFNVYGQERTDPRIAAMMERMPDGPCKLSPPNLPS